MIEQSIKQFRMKRKLEKDRLGAGKGTRERLGLAQRRIAQSSQNAQTLAKSFSDSAKRSEYDPANSIREWMQEYESIAEERGMDVSTTDALAEQPRPRGRYEQNFTGTVVPPENIRQDSSFTTAVSNLANKYEISEDEIFAVIKGESAFNPRARNRSGATGLFQFMPDTARELGVTTDEIMSMSPAQQVQLYDKYLERWDYNNSNRLGIMQAAPAYASSGLDEVIYDVGSAAWRQNPSWRELNDGPVTVRSINSYYARQS